MCASDIMRDIDNRVKAIWLKDHTLLFDYGTPDSYIKISLIPYKNQSGIRMNVSIKNRFGVDSIDRSVRFIKSDPDWRCRIFDIDDLIDNCKDLLNYAVTEDAIKLYVDRIGYRLKDLAVLR